MNRYAAKVLLFCLFCLVICGNSHACTPIDIFLYYHWSYVTYGTYGLSLDAFVASGGPAVDWAWYLSSGLAGTVALYDEYQSTAIGLGAATPGIYGVTVYAWNESGSYDWDYAYVIVCPTVQIGGTTTKLIRYNGMASPDVDFTATGGPSGGTYYWDEFRIGSGIVTLTNTTTPTVTVHPGAESSVPGGDVCLLVSYAYNGVTMTVGRFLTIVIPQKTSSTAGLVTEPTEYTWQRMYYHGLIDQLDQPMPEFLGVGATEALEHLSGKTGWSGSSPGDTATWPNDGPYHGEVVVRDVLGAMKSFGYATYRQTLTAGGFTTTPQYIMTLDTYNVNDPLHKED